MKHIQNNPLEIEGDIIEGTTKLNIQKVFTDDHQVKLTVTFDPETLESAKHRSARKIAQRTRIPGFRPGKAPYNVIVRTVGEPAVFQEAVDLILDEQYENIVKEAGIQPYSAGALNDMSSTDPLTLEFTIPLEAEVTIGDYKNVRLPYDYTPVSPEDVNQFLEDFRDRSATMQPTESPAVEGNIVFLKLSAERKEVAEGQSAALIAERSSTVTIKPEDASPSTEWPFPGFSRRLVGAKPGDEDSFEYTYPEDSNLEHLRGVSAAFHYQVEDVKTRQIPELSDEFAKSMGEFADLAALRSEVEKGLEEQRRSEYEREYHNQLVDKILETSEIKYPPQMLERELDVFIHQLEHRLEDQGLDMATYLKTRQMDEAAMRAEMKPSAEARLKRSLVIFKVANEEKIEIDEKEVQTEAIQTLNQISQAYSPQEARKLVTDDFVQNMISNITSDVLVKHTLERLVAYGKGELEPGAATEEAPVLEERGISAIVTAPDKVEGGMENVQPPAPDKVEGGMENAKSPAPDKVEGGMENAVVAEKKPKRKTKKESEG